MTPRPADAADAFGYGYARQRFAHELLKNAERSTMIELIARGDEEFRLDLSIRRRNAAHRRRQDRNPCTLQRTLD
jgi:hypothetical protein